MIIIPKKSNKSKKIGNIKKMTFNRIGFMSNVKNKYQMKLGKYFPSDANIQTTPFIDKICFLTESEGKDSKYQIKIFSAHSSGLPDKLLHDEPIIAIAKKGTKKSITDISNHHIVFPETGVFVVFEWMALEGNYYEIKSYHSNLKDKVITGHYNPKLNGIYIENPSLSKMNLSIPKVSDEWNKIDKFFDTENKKVDVEIQCELTLSN